MRATKLLPLVLGLVLALTGVARADIETVDQNGIRWRWTPATTVVEEQPVTIPGRWELRSEPVTEPGHWETQTRSVWIAPSVRYERRERVIPARVTIDHRGVRVSVGAQTVCETVPVQVPGRYETVCEKVWVPGQTRYVNQQVWVPARTEMRCVTVTKPGFWTRVACETPPCRDTVVTPVPLPSRPAAVVPHCQPCEEATTCDPLLLPRTGRTVTRTVPPTTTTNVLIPSCPAPTRRTETCPPERTWGVGIDLRLRRR